MRIFQFLLAVTILSVTITSCNQNYGKEYKLDKMHNVYYKGEGATEEQAKKLAEYLKKEDYFQDSIEATVQMIRIKDTFNLNFVVDQTKLIADYGDKYLLFGGYISKNVFNNAPVTMQLTDYKLNPFKNLGYAKPVVDSLQ